MGARRQKNEVNMKTMSYKWNTEGEYWQIEWSGANRSETKQIFEEAVLSKKPQVCVKSLSSLVKP